MLSTFNEEILLGKEKFMEPKWCGLRAERQKIKPEPGAVEQQVIFLQNKITDWDRCLAGDGGSEKHQQMTIELNGMKQDLLHMRRRLAGRTPSMKSWEDPL